MSKPRIIAFYLPQFHPIKENDEWYGKGFTEWTNVGRAKPLFRGHYQPKVPSDLGYYDLRLPEVREAQTELAKEAGVDAFCYYHYWFGKGKRIMELPIEEVVKTGKPNYPFCLCWANHSFYKKDWNSKIKSLDRTLLIEQKYPSTQDIIDHFNAIKHILKDKRYLKIDGKLLFVIYSINDLPNLKEFMEIWNNLAQKDGLPKFYFLSYATSSEEIYNTKYEVTNGIILDLKGHIFNQFKPSKKAFNWSRIKHHMGALINIPLNVKDYRKTKHLLINDLIKRSNIIPCLYPNWDNTPRRGGGGHVLKNSTPEEFKKLLIDTFELIKHKDENENILFIKSWNEWGEGNYMEPDLKYGHGYLEALREALTLVYK